MLPIEPILQEISKVYSGSTVGVPSAAGIYEMKKYSHHAQKDANLPQATPGSSKPAMTAPVLAHAADTDSSDLLSFEPHSSSANIVAPDLPSSAPSPTTALGREQKSLRMPWSPGLTQSRQDLENLDSGDPEIRTTQRSSRIAPGVMGTLDNINSPEEAARRLARDHLALRTTSIEIGPQELYADNGGSEGSIDNLIPTVPQARQPLLRPIGQFLARSQLEALKRLQRIAVSVRKHIFYLLEITAKQFHNLSRFNPIFLATIVFCILVPFASLMNILDFDLPLYARFLSIAGYSFIVSVVPRVAYWAYRWCWPPVRLYEAGEPFWPLIRRPPGFDSYVESRQGV
jgi:hypothetical protein